MPYSPGSVVRVASDEETNFVRCPSFVFQACLKKKKKPNSALVFHSVFPIFSNIEICTAKCFGSNKSQQRLYGCAQK